MMAAIDAEVTVAEKEMDDIEKTNKVGKYAFKDDAKE